MSEVQIGDRVRVTFEGEVTDAHPHQGRLRVATDDFDHGMSGSFGWVERGMVEKIAPPMETFGPGDVVRNSAHTYALTPTGFVVLDQGIFYTYGEGGRYQADDFTSDIFKRAAVS